jgi:hypothetical protein
VLLVLAMLLVFIGTLAQVQLGLYEVQYRFFQSYFVFWEPRGSGWKFPVFPGGYLIGGLLLINLVASLFRVVFTVKKVGILVIHAGLILLLVGQLATDQLASEGHLHMRLGESKNYSESDRLSELVVMDVTDAKQANVVAIPDSLLATRGTFDVPGMPLRVKVRRFMINARLAQQGGEGFERSPGGLGLGTNVWFQEVAPAAKMDERNLPAAVIEIEKAGGSALGTMLVSGQLDEAQRFATDGRRYEFALRLRRYYKPFSLALLEFRHDVYRGTDIPKNFSSLVRLDNPKTGETREVKIYMNNPLRYGGFTFYQSGFDRDNQGTILQVVRNPSWLAPYIACLIVSAGLAIQFLSSLIPFLKRRLAS